MNNSYSKQEVSAAVDYSVSVLSTFKKDRLGENDCWPFFLHYTSSLLQVTNLTAHSFEYKSTSELTKQLVSHFGSFELMFAAHGYSIKDSTNKVLDGDVSYWTWGDNTLSIILAKDNHWWTYTGIHGIKRIKRVSPIEKNLPFLARPIRKEQ